MYSYIIKVTACFMLLVALLPEVTDCKLVYITPRDSSSCPPGTSSQCITLSAYAASISDHSSTPDPNTTLIMLPGNHTLNISLTIGNISELSIVRETDAQALTKVVHVTCTRSAKFQLHNITKLVIRGLEWFSCADNYVDTVDNFLFENCQLNGQNLDGTGLQLSHVQWASIRKSSFNNLRGTRTLTPQGVVLVDGGAMILNHTNVLIESSEFDGNSAHDGGAIYATFSTINITSSTRFTNNQAEHNGGALYIWEGIVTVHNSTGSGNIALENGGFVYSTSNGIVTMEGCHLTLNTAAVGGAVRLQSGSTGLLVNCSLENNGAVYNTSDTFGGALCSTLSNSSIIETKFTNNNSTDYGGALYMYGGTHTLLNSELTHNGAERGGGMYVTTTHLNLQNVSFRENSACYDAGGLWAEDCILTMNASRFVRNSASLASAIRTSQATGDNRMDVIDSTFSYNTANFSTIYISQNIATFWGNTTYTHNNGSIFVYSSTMVVNGHATFAYNLYISKGSSIEEGGAITTYQSNITFNGHSVFSNNTAEYGGAIFATEGNIQNYGELVIANNTARSDGGGIYSYQTDLNFRASSAEIETNCAKKSGGGIYASSSPIRLFGGSLTFNKNEATMGGAVGLYLSGKLYIIKEKPECNASFCNIKQSEWIRLDFMENMASYGGAVYVADSSNCKSTPFQVRSTAGEECFFQSLSLYSFVDTKTMNYRNTRFIGNKASKDGHTIYGGLLDRCTVSPFSELFQNYYAVEQISSNSFTYLKNITNIEEENIHTEISSEAVRVCFCKKVGESYEQDCSYEPPTLRVKKEQRFIVPVVIVNQVNTSMNGTIQSVLQSGNGGLSEGQYSQMVVDPDTCTNLNFSISSPNQSEVISLYAEGPCKDIGISKRTFTVEFLSCKYCPIGFKVSRSGCDCECDPDLSDYISNCSFETQTVIRRDDAWITYNHVNDDSDLDGYITYKNCPYDYCKPSSDRVTINLNEVNGSDAQCNFNRANLLCGACKDGLSLTLGTSNCKKCSNDWLALLIFFAIAGIALVAFLLVFNLTVAVGTINGLILYANIVAANRATFLPFQRPNIFSVAIAWINLDFGFEACFYDGLNGYQKTWLQLAFPSYILLLVVMVLILGEKIQRFGALLHGRDTAATLGTLILLSYAKLHQIIIAVFASARIDYPNDSSRLVWLVDANVGYLEAKRIPLLLMAVIILVLVLAYIFFLISWQWLRKLSDRRAMKWLNNARLYTLVNPYFAPYSSKHQYWTGLLLLMRALSYIVVAANLQGDPSINLLSIIFLASIVFLLKERYKVKIYTSWPIDTLESSYIFNLIIFSAATLYVRITQGNQRALAYVSTSIALIQFLGILMYHTYAYVFPAKWREKLKSSLAKIFKSKPSKETYTESEESRLIRAQQTNPSYTRFTQYRESLLADDIQSSIQAEASLEPAVQSKQVTHSEISAIPTVDELLNRTH